MNDSFIGLQHEPLMSHYTYLCDIELKGLNCINGALFFTYSIVGYQSHSDLVTLALTIICKVDLA